MINSGKTPIINSDRQPSGQFVTIDGERFYEIADYDCMQPFFISLASDTDLWMYIASTGGLTAGRRSPDEALFPYYTDDKITENFENTGPRTEIRVDGKLWLPFSQRQQDVFEIRRKIAKSLTGNKLVFTEDNLSLQLRFSYMWAPAGKHGWVRRATLENLTGKPIDVDLTDSLLNVLPAGVERKTQNEFSTLVDGYKKTELVENTSLALFRMEAILVDRAEPSESLRCNTVYSLGLPNAEYDLTASKGVRGAFVAHSIIPSFTHSITWYTVCDVSQDAVQVHDLMHFIAQPDAIETIEKAITESTENLRRIVAQNDGVQHTADEYNDARHFANTLFNTMRGGFYLDNYNIGGEAFLRHVRLFNHAVAERHKSFLQSLPVTINYSDLQLQVEAQNDPQLTRLFLEYLPLTFGRRHGDPSRPWNLFNIRVQDAAGKPIVSYQGNWRDIFQNWEALSVSYPGFVNSIISKFLNATTVDGYNPYKLTSEGIDWEVINPENPWSNIGYWGDHQIIYLLKLLEISLSHDPETLRKMLNLRQFAFANVPYRFKSYDEIVADPKNTIRFDDKLHKHILSLIPDYGQDARLVLDKSGEVLLTTMVDKLLITLLQKLSNFIPEAGIWMNTLRPEWNDANNALVGYGASVVTLCYMRRYVAFLQQLIDCDIQIAKETAELLNALQKAYALTNRRDFIDSVGKAGEQYRTKAYAGLSGDHIIIINKESLQSFLSDTLSVIDHSIRKNRRDDGLYHAYNLIKLEKREKRKEESLLTTDSDKSLSKAVFERSGLSSLSDSGLEITHLYPMLEGQVAVLSSGILSAEEAADLLDAMRQSALYREDQRSYMLYPNRRRPSFMELNNIPEEAPQLPAIQKLLSISGQNVILEDCDGGLHFNSDFRNASFLKNNLFSLSNSGLLSLSEAVFVENLYESIFHHHAFTGRSGTFYKYEGLGCIYWHMVSKLLLAVGETIEKSNSLSLGEGRGEVSRLRAHYLSIREGIGSHKSPKEYGSFPFDPYSHTPSMAGVQQPGMTGQVKEDILNRFFELGVTVCNGQISFDPQMLTDADFMNGELRFTYCNTPVIYRKGENKGICVETKEKPFTFNLSPLTSDLSSHVFARDGFVKQIIVTL